MRALSTELFGFRCGEWVGFCCLLLGMFQDRTDRIWLMAKRDLWR